MGIDPDIKKEVQVLKIEVCTSFIVSFETRGSYDGNRHLTKIVLTVLIISCILLLNSLQNTGSSVVECLIRDRRARGFEPHRRHYVVVLEQDTFILA